MSNGSDPHITAFVTDIQNAIRKIGQDDGKELAGVLVPLLERIQNLEAKAGKDPPQLIQDKAQDLSLFEKLADRR